MARKLRLEFPGAIYHVLNRGNYRAWVFADPGTKAAFETCLFEACRRSEWLLHAYTIMDNHYHLALETPAGNLVAGMQWLQATFANRFNRFREECGHVFQGRYKGILVEPGDALGNVCHYIHLNPVRSGIVPVEQLAAYRHSSYWYLQRKRDRPAFLRPQTALVQAGGLADTPQGRAVYAEYLAWQAADGPAGRNRSYVSMSRGWALGSAEFKTALVADHRVAATARAWEAAGAAEIRERQWAAALTAALSALGKTDADAHSAAKSADWKVAIAAHLKATTQASNHWLAQHLAMGSPVSVSKYVGQLRRRAAAHPHSTLELRTTASAKT